METWGSHVDILRFYVHDKQLEKFPVDTLSTELSIDLGPYIQPVSMQRSDRLKERHIWEKMWRGWQSAARYYLNDADFFVKADIDSFIVVENLRAYLSFYPPSETHYLGHTLMHEWAKFNLCFNSGVGYVLSRETLRRYGQRLNYGLDTVEIHERKYQCYDRPGPLEDPNTGGCLRELNILPGDTLDSEGRQRFNTFRPRDLLFNMHYRPDDWYWRNKMSIGKKQLGFGCCSPTPMVWHNFKTGAGVFDKDAFHELEYVYHTQPYTAKLKAIELDPPSKQLFQFRPDELTFSVDTHRNAVFSKFDEDWKVGRWLKQHPELQPCFQTDSTCACSLPEAKDFPNGLQFRKNSPCFPGGSLKHGGSCAVECKEGYSKFIPRVEGKVYQGNTENFQCDGGMLMWPMQRCLSTCRVPNPPNSNMILSPGAGEFLSVGATSKISCTNSLHTFEAICRVDGRLHGPVHACSAANHCYRYSLRARGSKYQNEGWDELEFVGGNSVYFHVVPVASGSREDPVKNCHVFNIDEQLILVATEKYYSEQETILQTGTLVTPLSCANQDVEVLTASKESVACSNDASFPKF